MARLYDPHCPVARTMQVIGDPWTMLILRDLFRSKVRRFRDFQESLRGIAPTVLSTRLKWLEEQGVVATRPYSNHPPRAEYFLTDKGKRLGPVLKAMHDWGTRHPSEG